MAFKQVIDLDAPTSISLGGTDKSTRKANPTSAEGYYLGFKTTTSKFGDAKLHVLQTEHGNLGVWGKTDMDRKLGNVAPGSMVRITFTGEVPSNKGNPMKKFKVEVDADNTIDVGSLASNESGLDDTADDLEFEPLNDDLESEPMDEAPPARATAPAKPASVPDAARQAKVAALLAGRQKRA